MAKSKLKFRTRNALGKKYVVDDLSQSYKEVFSANANGAHLVLHDIAAFTFAGRTPATADERETLINIGRQQVWYHIQDFLRLDGAQLARVIAGIPIHFEEDDE